MQQMRFFCDLRRGCDLDRLHEYDASYDDAALSNVYGDLLFVGLGDLGPF